MEDGVEISEIGDEAASIFDLCFIGGEWGFITSGNLSIVTL